MIDRGYHTIWDITGVCAHLLSSDEALHQFFFGALQSSGFTVVSDIIHKFPSGGEGVTGLFLLSESHLSYHTYPETGYISIDVYTCGKNNHAINEKVSLFFGSGVQMNRRTLLRGSIITDISGVGYAVDR